MFGLLSQSLQNTTGYPWIAPFEGSQNGRDAWLALVTHYDGGNQKEKCISIAKANLSTIHYCNKATYGFEDFSRKFLHAIKDLDGTNDEYNNCQKVKLLLKKITVHHECLEVIKEHIHTNFDAAVDRAVEYLGTRFAEMFPQATAA